MKFVERIKEIFTKMFSSKKLLNEGSVEITSSEKIKESIDTEVEKNKTVSNGSTQYRELIELQKLYLQGKIKETDMTSDQVFALESLFDSQIENARRKNELTKKKILKALSEDQETMDIFAKIKRGDLEKGQLTDDQILQIEFLYDIEKTQINEIKKAKSAV